MSAFALYGCRTVKEYVPVAEVATEHVDREREVSDNVKESVKESTRESDSSETKVTVNEQGDTLRVDTRIVHVRDRTLETENERLRSVVDSLKSIKQDSVPVPYPVERKLTRWERTKQDYGGYALSAAAVALCIAVAWLARKIKR